MKAFLIITFYMLAIVCFGTTDEINFSKNQAGGDTVIVQTQSIGTVCSKYKRQGLFKNLVELNNEFNPHKAYDPNCSNTISQQVDFSRQDLILIDEAIGGCDPPTVAYKLLKIDELKKYVFVVNITQNGYCKVLFPVIVSVKCEKLDSSYSFEYKIEQIK